MSLTPRWSYSNPKGLTQWYGHVDYYGPYVIGQWFSLDAETGTEHWSRRFFRLNDICDCAGDVIVGSEMRSDGPWTCIFGIYAISAKTGDLLWISHRRGWWGKLVRAFDYVPGFTNDLRDHPRCIEGSTVITGAGRVLDLQTGRTISSGYPVPVGPIPEKDALEPPQRLYREHVVPMDDGTLEWLREPGFVLVRRDAEHRQVWRFSARQLGLHAQGNYYSFRLHGDRILVVLGDAPCRVPHPTKKQYVVPNPANYQMGIIDLSSGHCALHPLGRANRECRIEAVQGSRVLVSRDNTHLSEYEISGDTQSI